MTLNSKNMCEIPQGKLRCLQAGHGLQNAHESVTNRNSLLQIPQLVTPLREDTDGVLDERHDD